MPPQPLIIVALAMLAVIFIYIGGMSTAREVERSSRLKRRAEGATAGGRPGLGERLDAWFKNALTKLGAKLGPQDSESLTGTRRKLVQSGIRKPTAPYIFWGVKVFLSLALGAVALLALKAASIKSLAMVHLAGAGLLAAAVGMYAPEFWLSNKLSKRKKAILEELPDALDLLVVCVESGMGLDQAVHRVAQETADSAVNISEELGLLNLEMRTGKPRQEAFRSLSDRIGVEDVTTLVTLVIQSDMFGTSIAQTLRVYSDTLRTKRYQRAEEKAARLPILLLFPLIMFIFPSLFVVIMGPPIVQIFFSS